MQINLDMENFPCDDFFCVFSFKSKFLYAALFNNSKSRETGMKKKWDLVHFLVNFCLSGIIEIIKLMLILGQVMLIIG